MMKTRASLIVINWNGAAFLDACLQALLPQAQAGDEIIVVDNDSTDDSVQLVQAHFSGVQVLCNERNRGYAGGANTGLRAAQGDTLVLLNPDVKVHAGCLAALKEALGEKKVGVVGCKLYYPGGDVIQHAGGIITFPQATADHHGYRQRDNGQWEQERQVDYVTGAALALQRDVLDEVGFFDEGFYPAYYEEADYCFRARQAGYEVHYAPQAVATHHEHAALGEESYHYLRYFHRNRLRFVLKHRGPRYFLDDFMPAEMDWLKKAPLRARYVLNNAYLDVMLDYPKYHLDQSEINAVIQALSNLRDTLKNKNILTTDCTDCTDF
jgi:GT2 family glycosyltransferase